MKILETEKFFYILPTAYGTPVLSVRWLCFQYYDNEICDHVPLWLEVVAWPGRVWRALVLRVAGR